MAGAHVGRQQLPSVRQHDGAQRGALRQRQALPHSLEHRFLLGKQPVERRVQIVHADPALACWRARRPSSRARAAARRTACCRPGRRSRRRGPASGLMPVLRKSRFDERREQIGGNLLQPHHRSGLVERPLRPEHPLHQTGLGAGEDIADARADAARRPAARARRCRR